MCAGVGEGLGGQSSGGGRESTRCNVLQQWSVSLGDGVPGLSLFFGTCLDFFLNVIYTEAQSKQNHARLTIYKADFMHCSVSHSIMFQVHARAHTCTHTHTHTQLPI